MVQREDPILERRKAAGCAAWQGAGRSRVGGVWIEPGFAAVSDTGSAGPVSGGGGAAGVGRPAKGMFRVERGSPVGPSLCHRQLRVSSSRQRLHPSRTSRLHPGAATAKDVSQRLPLRVKIARFAQHLPTRPNH